MKPGIRSWTMLLVAGILFVSGLFWVRANPPADKDPLMEARDGLAKAFGLEVALKAGREGGLLVEGVRPGSPAERAGIQVGDRVVACGDRSVWHVYQLAEFISEDVRAGPAVSLLVQRDDKYWPAVFGARPRAMRDGRARRFAQLAGAPVT